MKFSIRGTVLTGIDALDYAISDLVVLRDGATATVFATSGANGGLSSYRLSENHTATVVDHAVFNPLWATGIGPDLALIADPGGLKAVFGMTASTSAGAFYIGTDGTIGPFTEIDGLLPGLVRTNALGTGADGSLLVAGVDRGFSSYEVENTNAAILSSTGDSATTVSEDFLALQSIDVNGADYIIAASQSGQKLFTFANGPDGLSSVNATGSLSDVGIMIPTDIACAKVASSAYVIVASAAENSGALSVFEIGDDGSLTATDHVLDTLQTRFGMVQSVATMDHQGMTFVVAGGGDDGLSLFVLLPGGQLQLLETISDTLAAGLENISAIAGVSIGSHLRILVGTQSEGLFTDLSVDLSSLGIQGQADLDGSPLIGTVKDDILVGNIGADIIQGGQGNDILVDGEGIDTLSGGTGRDVFVFRDDGVEDRVTDFNPLADRLDLASWPMLHDSNSLSIAPTANGAVLTWRNETLFLSSETGLPLSIEAVRAAVNIQINRPMDLSPINFPEEGDDGDAGVEPDPDPNPNSGDDEDDDSGSGSGKDEGVLPNEETPAVELRGDNRNDSLVGGAGDDFLSGGAGHDSLDGDDGDDRIFGGSGNDEVFGRAGEDTLHGDLGDDLLYGGPSVDRLFGGDGSDNLFGDDGDDELDGATGNDKLVGGNGDDILIGGAGRDRLEGEAGDDTLLGGRGSDRLFGGSDNDMISGQGRSDYLFGNEGRDHLLGGAGRDRLYGGSETDILVGGGGRDRLTGGDGADTFVFSKMSGRDQILDFNVHEDVIALQGVPQSSVDLVQTSLGLCIDWGKASVFLLGVGDGDYQKSMIEFDLDL